MLKSFLVLVVVFFVGAYAWGWYANVQQGTMSTGMYTRRYQILIEDRVSRLWTKVCAFSALKPHRNEDMSFWSREHKVKN